MTDLTFDTDDQSGTDEGVYATDRRTFLGALTASALLVGLASAGTAAGLQNESETATVPWTESFEGDDGTTDDSGETAWEIENPDTHPDVGVDSNAPAEQAGLSGTASIDASGFQRDQASSHYCNRVGYSFNAMKTTLLVYTEPLAIIDAHFMIKRL